MDTNAQADKGSLYPSQATRVIIPASVEPIHTKNLLLRPLQVSDAADIFEYRSRQDVANWLWPKTPHKSLEETEQSILKKTFQTADASGAVGRQFTFAMIRANDPDQKVIGAVGINALIPAPSIGYGTHPDLWGKGYVSEAVAGVVDAWWKLERRDAGQSTALATQKEKLFAACNMANVGSVRVLQKNGFERLREFFLEGDVVALFGLEMP